MSHMFIVAPSKIVADARDPNANQGTKKVIDPFTHQADYDFFYDPLSCAPFYANTSEPIWYGRVENLKPEN